MMPRRRPMVTLMATAIVALSGCTVNVNVPGETATTPPTGPAATTPAGTTPAGTTPAGTPPEAGTYAFVGVVREKLPELGGGRGDEELQAMADVICNALAKDAKSGDVVDATRSMGSRDGTPIDHATANEVIKLAIDTSCPGQASRVDEF